MAYMPPGGEFWYFADIVFEKIKIIDTLPGNNLYTCFFSVKMSLTYVASFV